MKYLCVISFDEKKMDALSKQGRTRSADRYSQATARTAHTPGCCGCRRRAISRQRTIHWTTSAKGYIPDHGGYRKERG
jgi:hypothetical protein